jgi:hypothetical protein
MKRCPKCEFIYEDEQSLCDMDGVLLVFDSRALPNLHAVAAKTDAKRNRAVPVFASLILALVLGMVYYVSTQRKQAVVAPAAAGSVANPAPVLNPTPAPAESVQPTPAVEEPKETPKPAAVTPVRKPVTKTATKAPAKPATVKKDGSKVNSILKKTGRILKKPFKF